MTDGTITGYHFTGHTLCDGSSIPPIGEWLRWDGDVIPCESGLHASGHVFDALRYAPGTALHLVELRGDLQWHGDPPDKWAGRERRILLTIDAAQLLREFARWCALQVIDLWDAPAIVRQYLETGGDVVREEAWSASRAAALAASPGRRADDSVSDAASAAAWASNPGWTQAAVSNAVWAAERAAQRAAASAAAEDKHRHKLAEMVDAVINAAKGVEGE